MQAFLIGKEITFVWIERLYIIFEYKGYDYCVRKMSMLMTTIKERQGRQTRNAGV